MPLNQRGPFNPDVHLKCRLAAHFLRDANDFLWLTSLADRSDFQHRAFRAKIFVDMLMAAECALKSIILILSPRLEGPDDSYKVIRKCGHDLATLVRIAAQRARGRVAFLTGDELKVLEKAASLGVRSRYSADVFFMLMHEDPQDRFLSLGKITSTIDDSEWMKTLHRVVARAARVAKTANVRYCGKYHIIRGTDVRPLDQRYKQFLMHNNIKP